MMKMTGREITGALLHVGLVAVAAIAIKFAVIYAVDSSRSASRWTVYTSVNSTQINWPVGRKPLFRSKAIRFYDVGMSWWDLMYCRPTTGPEKGKLIFIGSQPDRGIYKVPKAYIGYDELPHNADSSYKLLDGYWTWEGPLPDYPARCFIEPQPYVHPSPGVTPKLAPVPQSDIFEFYVPRPDQ